MCSLFSWWTVPSDWKRGWVYRSVELHNREDQEGSEVPGSGTVHVPWVALMLWGKHLLSERNSLAVCSMPSTIEITVIFKLLYCQKNKMFWQEAFSKPSNVVLSCDWVQHCQQLIKNILSVHSNVCESFMLLCSTNETGNINFKVSDDKRPFSTFLMNIYNFYLKDLFMWVFDKIQWHSAWLCCVMSVP
jgi:hypothetical protein